jgi:hypothetical protein
MEFFFQLKHFFCVDDESLIHVKMPQVMSYMMCCIRILSQALLKQRTKLRKGFVSYFKSNEITH